MKIKYGIVLVVVSGLFAMFIWAYNDYQGDTSDEPIVQQQTEETIVLATPDELYLELSDIRKEFGLSQLAYSKDLNETAELKCSDMVENRYYAHENPDTGYKGYEYILDNLPNVEYASENLNTGPNYSAQGFTDSWMESAPHRSAILDERYDLTGFAICKVNGDYVAVHHMAEIGTVSKQTQTQQSQSQRQQSDFRYELLPYGNPTNNTTCTSRYYDLTDEFVTECN